MLSRPAFIAALFLLPLATGALLSGATGASAQERCTGTLCDFYYGGPPTDPDAKPTGAPHPLTAPSGVLSKVFGGAPQPTTGGAAPAAKSVVAVQGGGLLSLMRGGPQERCTGTLCDVYYGGPPPEKPAAPATQATDAQAADAQPTDQPAPEPAADTDEPPARVSRRVTEEEPKPGCYNPRDPWKCYR